MKIVITVFLLKEDKVVGKNDAILVTKWSMAGYYFNS